MSNLTPELIYRRNLPHIQPPGGTFFVTFRLAGSIPADVLAMLHAEAERIHAELERMPASPERAERLYLEERRFFGKWDAVLDQGKVPTGCGTRNEVAKLGCRRHALLRRETLRLARLLHHVKPRPRGLHTAAEGCGRVLPTGADHAHDEGLYGRTGQSNLGPIRLLFWLHEIIISKNKLYSRTGQSAWTVPARFGCTRVMITTCAARRNWSALSPMSRITRSKPAWCRIGRTGRGRIIEMHNPASHNPADCDTRLYRNPLDCASNGRCYDHYVHSAAELERILAYVANDRSKPGWWRIGRTGRGHITETHNLADHNPADCDTRLVPQSAGLRVQPLTEQKAQPMPKPTSTTITAHKHTDRRANIPTEELRDFVAEDEQSPVTHALSARPVAGPAAGLEGQG